MDNTQYPTYSNQMISTHYQIQNQNNGNPSSMSIKNNQNPLNIPTKYVKFFDI